jgi:hypothetical protein
MGKASITHLSVLDQSAFALRPATRPGHLMTASGGAVELQNAMCAKGMS